MSASHAARTRTPKGNLNLWCSNCETAFPAELTAWLSREQMACPRCRSVRNVLPWEQIRLFRPDYPRQPEYGRTYSLTLTSCR